jgi:hypothetical protein
MPGALHKHCGGIGVGKAWDERFFARKSGINMDKDLIAYSCAAMTT